jgi:hypothetical protein
MAKPSKKTVFIEKLYTLIGEAPGQRTSWPDLSTDLRKLSIRSLNALIYRIEAVSSQSYNEGLETGHAAGLNGYDLV